MLMENAGGQVVGLTTDGASTNRTMWGHLGVFFLGIFVFKIFLFIYILIR